MTPIRDPRPAAQTVGVVTGLLSEAGCLPSGGPKIYVSAGVAVNAHGGAIRLISDGAAALISFGIAGGLDPKLKPGTLVLARAVTAPEGARYECDEGWRKQVAAEARGDIALADGIIAGRDAPVLGVEEKAQLYIETGAAAADMESHAVAAAAAEAKIPFLAVRAIADPARRRVPAFALTGVDAQGRTRAMPVLMQALIRPWEWTALIALARDHAAAMAALRRAGRLRSLFVLPR